MPPDDEVPAAVVAVEGLDHFVLDVTDVERSLRFYCGVLGLEPVRLDEWRAGRVPFPSARIDASTIIDLLAKDSTGENVDHFCLVVSPTDFEDLEARAARRGRGPGVPLRSPRARYVALRP